MIRGIPCKVKVPDEKGNLTDVITFHFATFRACPKLAVIVKDLQRLQTSARVARRRAEILEQEIDECADDTALDEIAVRLTAARESASALDDQAVALYEQFVTAGIVGAGYSEDDASRFFAMIDQSHIPDLINKARLGAGRIDFF
jgi:hypothetical protein